MKYPFGCCLKSTSNSAIIESRSNMLASSSDSETLELHIVRYVEKKVNCWKGFPKGTIISSRSRDLLKELNKVPMEPGKGSEIIEKLITQ